MMSSDIAYKRATHGFLVNINDCIMNQCPVMYWNQCTCTRFLGAKRFALIVAWKALVLVDWSQGLKAHTIGERLDCCHGGQQNRPWLTSVFLNTRSHSRTTKPFLCNLYQRPTLINCYKRYSDHWNDNF